MSKGLILEKNLPHQDKAIDCTTRVFSGISVSGAREAEVNPVMNFEILNNKVIMDGHITRNVRAIQKENNIDNKNKNEYIFDIQMETGTGKTYTYTKTIFELNIKYNLHKFIIVVPSLAIKAGTVNFLKNSSTKEHFRQEYNKEIKTYVVENKKSKSKKSYLLQSIKEFSQVRQTRDKIHVLIINSGMINSKSMLEEVDVNLFENINTNFEALKYIKPVIIIDEPHKFASSKSTFKKITDLEPQFILRYGATFNDDYFNLVYNLNAIDAFNNDLVKGINAYVEEFKEGENSIVKLLSANSSEASFELIENNKSKKVKLGIKDTLTQIHREFIGIEIEKIGKDKVILSNGLELNKSDRINPYSYSTTLQDIMIKEAIKNHFKLEKELLENTPRIKPLTLFFIDNIEMYRKTDGIGELQIKLEEYAKIEIELLLADKTIKDSYREYLEISLKNLRQLHGGYFSKDNKDTDENIEQEIDEILHDKVTLLSLENPRRFIVSKWTLKEGWDNPNIFQICKLRSSGSETSKLQEVGRGLRLPVNEFMARDKSGKHKLNYYVDFTEKDFVHKLIGEINKSAREVYSETELEARLLNKITKIYDLSNDEVLEQLDDRNIINRSNKFKDSNGLEEVKKLYPLAFEVVKDDKVKDGREKSNKVSIRLDNYKKLKDLWEKINEKAILSYKIGNEKAYYNLLLEMFNNKKEMFENENIYIKKVDIQVTDRAKISEVNEITPVIQNRNRMEYNEFLVRISKELNINIKTLHKVFVELDAQKAINMTNLYSIETIRKIKKIFIYYILENYVTKEAISYNKIDIDIHPTAFTDSTGDPKLVVDASNLGVNSVDDKPPVNYLFKSIYYDSELEKDNIQNPPVNIVVYTKIPKNSIKIPVVGGLSYSPDFAYVVEYENGNQKLNLVVETKGKDEGNLGVEEKQKIESARMFFETLSKSSKTKINLEFKPQLKNEKIVDIINGIIKKIGGPNDNA